MKIKFYLIFVLISLSCPSVNAGVLDQCQTFIKKVNRVFHETILNNLPARIRTLYHQNKSDPVVDLILQDPLHYYKKRIASTMLVTEHNGVKLNRPIINFEMPEAVQNVRTMKEHIQESKSLVKKNLRKVSNDLNDLKENLIELDQFEKKIDEVIRLNKITYLDYLYFSNCYAILMDLKYSVPRSTFMNNGRALIKSDFEVRWEGFLGLLQEQIADQKILFIPTFKDLSILDFNQISYVPIKYLGLTPKNLVADGAELTPFGFFDHDLGHAQQTLLLHSKTNVEELKTFYVELRKKIDSINDINQRIDSDILYFHFIHETTGNIFLAKNDLIEFYKNISEQEIKIVGATFRYNFNREFSSQEIKQKVKAFLKILQD